MWVLFIIVALMIIAICGCIFNRKAGSMDANPRVQNYLLGRYVYVGIPHYQIELKYYTVPGAPTQHANIIAQRYLYGQLYEGEFTLEYWDEGVYRWKYPTNNMFTYFTIVNHNPPVIEQTSEHNPTYTLLKID